MLKASPQADAEEWAIHADEGFAPVELREYEDLEHVAVLAAFIQERGRLGAELVSHTGSLDEAKDILENRYAGAYDSLTHFAEELLEDTGALKEVPENLRRYLDFDAYGRDLVLGGDVDTLEVGGEVHVFWTR